MIGMSPDTDVPAATRIYLGVDDALGAIMKYHESGDQHSISVALTALFARRRCYTCHGRGSVVFVHTGDRANEPASLRYCSCVQHRMKSAAQKLYLSGQQYTGQEL